LFFCSLSSIIENKTLDHKTAYHQLIQSLVSIYDQREAETIVQYIFEDVFNIRRPLSDFIFNNKEQSQLENIKTRLLNHEPWQYIIGQADFYGLKFNVNPNVLIPRPETEELVYQILQDLKTSELVQPTILDIGTGSGCIPITIQKENPNTQVSAIDISIAAIQTAQSNAQLNEVQVNFQVFDILNKKHWQELGQFDVIVSNPPYIPNKEKALMHRNVLDHEPQLALFVEDDQPLIFYETIAEFAQAHLNKNGVLYFEINEFSGKATIEVLKKLNYKNVQLIQDMSGRDRIAMGTI
jgi:release factor glutamine methyltransferase